MRLAQAIRRENTGVDVVVSQSVFSSISTALAALAGAVMGILLAAMVIFPFSTLISGRLELPYLEAPLFNILALVFVPLSVRTTGPLASLYVALKISKAETYFTMREGRRVMGLLELRKLTKEYQRGDGCLMR
jgi:hypothetical protein